MPIIPGTGIAPGMAGMAGIVPGIPGIAIGIPIAGAMLGQLGIAGTCAVKDPQLLAALLLVIWLGNSRIR